MKSFSVQLLFLIGAVVVAISKATPVPNEDENPWKLIGPFEKEGRKNPNIPGRLWKSLSLHASLDLAIQSPGIWLLLRDCSKDVTIGPYSCAALFWRYKWSVDDNKCIKTVYGGCRPTKNNFSDEDECTRVAAPVCKA